MALKPSSVRYLDDLVVRQPALIGQRESILLAVETMVGCAKAGGKILVCGNGGSAADSDHIVGELMKGFLLKREVPESFAAQMKAFDDGEQIARGLQCGIPAIALTQHAALSTAVLNDNDPYMGFAQQVYALGKPGDVLIGLSTSGKAKNVGYALKVGKVLGLTNIGLTGSKDSPMDPLCHITIKAPISETFLVQEYHLPIYHVICAMVEEEVFG